MQLFALKAWYDQRLGMVTLEDDVLSVVQQVRELYSGRVTVELDPHQGVYHLVEHCDDSTDRLIFTVDQLDGRVVQRLMQADSQARGYEDPYDAAERSQDELQVETDRRFREGILEQGEALAHALKKDGVMPRLPLSVSMPRGVDDA